MPERQKGRVQAASTLGDKFRKFGCTRHTLFIAKSRFRLKRDIGRLP